MEEYTQYNDKNESFAISTDSTCDLYSDEIKNNGIFFLPLSYTMTENGIIKEYKDEFSGLNEYAEFYKKLSSGVLCKTSMNNPYIHEKYFRSLIEKGVKNVIHFTISYGLCKTVDVANEVVKTLKEEYKDFNCLCVECSSTTISQGMLVKIALDMKKRGKTLIETYDYIQKIKHNIQHFIIADNLMYLMRGGRLSPPKALLGTMLNVKPIIVFNKKGELAIYKKVRGIKNAVIKISDEIASYTLNKEYPIVIIGHTGNIEMAELLYRTLKERYNINAEIRYIGPVIGAHLGPNAVAYVFLSNEERPI